MPTVPSERMPRWTVPPTINRDPSGSAAGVWANAELARPPKSRTAISNRIGSSWLRGENEKSDRDMFIASPCEYASDSHPDHPESRDRQQHLNWRAAFCPQRLSF